MITRKNDAFVAKIVKTRLTMFFYEKEKIAESLWIWSIGVLSGGVESPKTGNVFFATFLIKK